MLPSLGSLISVEYFKANGLSRACRPIGILDPDEVLQDLWPISLGRVALLGSLILMKYFKACGLFGACRPIGIFDPGEVLQGQWPIWGMSPWWDL